MTKTKKAGKGKRGTDSHRVNASEIARQCGLSRQRVSVLLAEGYSPAAILRRQARKAADLSAGGKGDGTRPRRRSESLLRSRARKESALAGLRELELRQREGSLIDRDQVLAENATAIITTRNRFLRLPGELRDQCDRQPGAVVEQLYDTAIRDILAGFSRALNMTEADVERGWRLWDEFLAWVKKKESINGHA